jgi:hypothetical protein
VIHGASNDRLERWVLNAYGDVLETATKSLETSIEMFSVDRSGAIMVSYEDNFIILRNDDLRVFHTIKYGKELPTNGVIIPQINTKKLQLLACYESGLVLVCFLFPMHLPFSEFYFQGWEIPSPESSVSTDLAAYFSQPIFQMKLPSKSPLCGIIEVLNTERLHHRRLCVGSRGGQLWILEWV